MSDELKPCPLCGSAAVTLKEDSIGYEAVLCQKCGVEGSEWIAEELAIDAWNRRPIEDALRVTNVSLLRFTDELQVEITRLTAENEDLKAGDIACLADLSPNEIGRLQEANNWILAPGECLHLWRKENHITLKELSTVSGLSVSFLSDIEHGRANPSLRAMRELLMWKERPDEVKKGVPDNLTEVAP